MNSIRLPDAFLGKWDHALIVTYGADLPFFERDIWKQFSDQCRNRIILTDGRRYQQICAELARSGMVRHLNQRYVADGIYSPRISHAKLVLLTNSDKGRLLVGSGNLGM